LFVLFVLLSIVVVLFVGSFQTEAMEAERVEIVLVWLLVGPETNPLVGLLVAINLVGLLAGPEIRSIIVPNRSQSRDLTRPDCDFFFKFEYFDHFD
jgi:hypothetical protein